MIFACFVVIYCDHLRLSLCSEACYVFMTETFKITNKEGPAYLHDLMTVTESQYDIRNHLIMQQPKYNTIKYGFNSLRYQGPMMWNKLSVDIKKSNDLNEFKFKLSKWEGPKCSCMNCELCVLNYM